MDELTTFVYIGDNEHDDAADGVTQLAITLAGKRFAEAAKPLIITFGIAFTAASTAALPAKMQTKA